MAFRWTDKFGLLGTFAGALAFYFLLAMVPLFILAATLVYSVLGVDVTPQLLEMLRELMPVGETNTPDRVVAAVIAGTTRGWFTVGFIGTIWASASFMNELARAIHLLFSENLDARAGGWVRWLKALGLMMLWCAAVTGASVLFFLAEALPALFAQWPLVEKAAIALSQASRATVTLGLLFAAVVLTFRVIPVRPARWKACALGAVGVSLAWMVMGGVLTRVLPIIWAQSPLPVAFGSFLVTMFWAYACCWVLLLGALFVARFGRNF
jgi:uncharacterized BrkB/YihY/UPF0761 family membrane protein